uniref:FH2 domain-containing protein n=1 Tax=Macrostomum lignano TaxID=282301 RepID=A0A1I8FSH0_9PLAT
AAVDSERPNSGLPSSNGIGGATSECRRLVVKARLRVEKQQRRLEKADSDGASVERRQSRRQSEENGGIELIGSIRPSDLTGQQQQWRLRTSPHFTLGDRIQPLPRRCDSATATESRRIVGCYYATSIAAAAALLLQWLLQQRPPHRLPSPQCAPRLRRLRNSRLACRLLDLPFAPDAMRGCPDLRGLLHEISNDGARERFSSFLEELRAPSGRFSRESSWRKKEIDMSIFNGVVQVKKRRHASDNGGGLQAAAVERP